MQIRGLRFVSKLENLSFFDIKSRFIYNFNIMIKIKLIQIKPFNRDCMRYRVGHKLVYCFRDFFISCDSISGIKETSSPHLPSIVPLRSRENLRTYARADTDRRYRRRDRETAAIECVPNGRFAKENEINKERPRGKIE